MATTISPKSVTAARAGTESQRGVAMPSLPVATGTFAMVVGATMLLGWLTGTQILTTLGLSTDAAKANGSLGLLLLGAAVALLDLLRNRPWLGVMLALAASAIGSVTLLEYLAGANLGIDQWLASDPAQETFPGRMAPFTAFSLGALGLAAVLARFRRLRPLVIAMAAAVIAFGAMNVFNWMFGGSRPAVIAQVPAMHPVSGLALVGLGFGVLDLLGARSPLELIRGRSGSATMGRRLAVTMAIVVVGLTWLGVVGESIGLYNSQFGASLDLALTLLILAVVIAWATFGARRTEQERAAAQVERDRFFDLSLDLMPTASADGRFIRLNRAWTTTLGYSLEELMSRPFTDFVHPDDVEATQYEMKRQFEEGKPVLHFQNRYRHADGKYRWLEWSSHPGVDIGVVYAVARDVTVHKLEEERLTRRAASLAVKNERLADRAVRDPLTGLHNRAYLDAAIERLTTRRRRSTDGGQEAGPLAEIIFDLDLFGAFNKEYGHQAGDVVLRAFAGVLQRRFRGGDVLARYGGEEFVVVMPGAGRDDARRAADEVRAEFAATEIDFDGNRLSATVSAGCAELEEGMAMADLLAAADTALAMAKRAGRNMVVAA